MRGWCLTDSFIEDFKALHCFSQLKVIRIMVNATMKRVILESQLSRDLTGNIISWIRSFRQTLAVQFVSKSKQSDWLLKIRSNLIAYWLNGVTTLGKTRVAFVYKMNHSRCKHDGGPDDIEEGDDDGHGHDAGDQRQQHEGQRDESELESQLK